tara:strand:+ start:459 stop:701 length:243 start_codon:yes stop_codon:yes gene_type:complete
MEGSNMDEFTMGRVTFALKSAEEILDAETTADITKQFLIRNAWDMTRLALKNLQRLEQYQREHQVSSGVYTEHNDSTEVR